MDILGQMIFHSLEISSLSVIDHILSHILTENYFLAPILLLNAYFKTSSEDSWYSDQSQGQREGCCIMSALCIPGILGTIRYQ